MNNVYATPYEVKQAMPDAIKDSTTKYDLILLRLARAVSRFIDGRCGRVFYPSYGVKYFQGDGSELLVVPDLVAAVTVETSDDGQTFTALTTDDYYGSVYDDENSPRSYRTLVATVWGNLGAWPTIRRGVKITGWWGFADDRANAFEASGATLAAIFTLGTATLAVTDKGATDSWGLQAFHTGRILRLEDELFEVTSVADGTPNDTLSILPGRNGTTAAGHANATPIKLWRMAEDVKQATIIQCARQLERGLQGFGDARANPELGTTLYTKRIDPEADLLLNPYMVLR